ncbi:MAG: hypothetical protein VX646_03360 [Verrucomicrobiota bacterium]|nr:hypothetical protein [Verrucomicrobiales bacterium]MEC9035263.1 hypothetical protein [Verrucomicrobiota bacterium]MEE2966896.1 hypothetical protein [Verrucomicrobiota bacterium]HAA88074.1 hypothetical protein [Verrucomicrobiales bacterium]
MVLKFIIRVIPVMALAGIMVTLFSGCEATQVGNYKGTGVNSGLSNLPQARHEAWESNARYGNLPQSQ